MYFWGTRIVSLYTNVDVLHLKSRLLVQMESCLVIRFSEEWFTSVQQGMWDVSFFLAGRFAFESEWIVVMPSCRSTRFPLILEIEMPRFQDWQCKLVWLPWSKNEQVYICIGPRNTRSLKQWARVHRPSLGSVSDGIHYWQALHDQGLCLAWGQALRVLARRLPV